jgi:hypothetical protein
MGAMFGIGQFAQIAKVSVRTLRHYDDLGLLTPAAVDAASGYRYYRADQLACAESHPRAQRPRLHTGGDRRDERRAAERTEELENRTVGEVIDVLSRSTVPVRCAGPGRPNAASSATAASSRS